MNCSPEIKEGIKELLSEWKILESNKDLNRLFNNRQGAIHQSLFSKRQHDPYKLNPAALGGIDYLDKLEVYLSGLEEQASSVSISVEKFPPVSVQKFPLSLGYLRCF